MGDDVEILTELRKTTLTALLLATDAVISSWKAAAALIMVSSFNLEVMIAFVCC